RIWLAPRIFYCPRSGSDVRAIESRPAPGLADWTACQDLYTARHGRSCILDLSPAVRAPSDHSVYARYPSPMTNSLAEHCFDVILWLAGAGHFVILAASFQVPARLRWKQDLAQLMPFNRKLLWVQSAFTVLTIITFGTLTLVLHKELLRGDRAAL